MHRARVWFAAHGITHIQRIVTDNGACYRAKDFAHVLHGARHQFIAPYTPRHNGKVERYHRILAEEFLYARTWTSETQRAEALKIWNIHFQLPPTTLCRRRPATSITTRHRRHQPHGLIQLAAMSDDGRRGRQTAHSTGRLALTCWTEFLGRAALAPDREPTENLGALRAVK
jgi:transposase InsO family protein